MSTFGTIWCIFIPTSGHFSQISRDKHQGPILFNVYFRPFLVTISIIQIEKSLDSVLGIQTCGRRMIGADETTELWRPPYQGPNLIK